MARELARDGDRDDRAAFPAPLERVPALVEPSRAPVGAGAYRGGLALSALGEGCAFAQRPPLLPGD